MKNHSKPIRLAHERASTSQTSSVLDDDSDERAVLGALVFQPGETITSLGGALDPALFASPPCRTMLDAVIRLWSEGAPIDTVTVIGKLHDLGQLEGVGGASVVSQLTTGNACTPVAAEYHLGRLRDRAARRRTVELSDWLREAAQNRMTDPQECVAKMEDAVRYVRALQDAGAKRALVEFKKPSELRAFVPPEGWNLVGDYHIQRGSPFVIGGAPGVGKSRAATALAVAGATGMPWFGFPVRQQFKTMILQAENGRVRLRDEYATLDKPEFDQYIRVSEIPPFGFELSNPEFRAQLQAAIADFKPDVVIIDPWNRATSEDKSKDYLETFNLLLALLSTCETNPALGVVAHTRKPAAGERTNGRALLNVLAGGYALGSVPRSAFVIQHASDGSEETRVVVTCCKNNDGPPGERTAWERGNGLFQPVEDFDWQEFDYPGEKRRVVEAADLEAIFAPDEGEAGCQLLTKKAAVARLMERTGCKEAACYRALEAGGKFKTYLAEKSGLLTFKQQNP